MRVKHLCGALALLSGCKRYSGGSKKRSRRLAREVCRVVRASHAVVMRDCWIGTDWPGHVYTVVTDTRCDQSIGCDSGLAPTL